LINLDTTSDSTLNDVKCIVGNHFGNQYFEMILYVDYESVGTIELASSNAARNEALFKWCIEIIEAVLRVGTTPTEEFFC